MVLGPAEPVDPLGDRAVSSRTVGPWDLAVIVPISFLLQMAPISINGFGVREAAFSLYFARLRLPLESALLVSLVPTILVMFFSLSGAAVYVGRGGRHAAMPVPKA